jgi:LysM repeat protein
MVDIMNGTIRYTILPYDTLWMLAQVFNTSVDQIMELNPGIDPRKLQIGQVVTILPGYANYPSVQDEQNVNGMETDNIELEMDLTSYMHLLWEQHSEWTRMAVMGLVHDLPEAQLILQRLLRNPADFAAAFTPFYGAQASQEFADLLTAHLTIAAELVQDAKAGNTDAYSEAEQRWFDNADQMSELLASINPYWSVEDWSAMFDEHLRLLAENVSQMINQDYAASISGYDEIELQALEMADMMAEGIAMQFPG